MRRRKGLGGAFFAIVIAVVLAVALFAYLRLHQSEGVKFAMNMNPGWNLANTLDAYGLGRGAGTPEVYETYWGSAPVTQAYLHTIAVAGFRTLRVPVTWFEHMDEEHRIQEPWLNRVQAVVDMALREGMYVILNAHHDAWYTPNPATLDRAVSTLQAVWGQIADRFAAYGDHLLFESMNEPRLIGDPTEWTGGTLQTRECVNCLNAAFVATVRAAGDVSGGFYGVNARTNAGSQGRISIDVDGDVTAGLAI